MITKTQDRLITRNQIRKLYCILGERELLEYFGMQIPREMDILTDKWRDNKTLKEIGEKYDITAERVRQIIDRAVRKLSRNIKSASIECYEIRSIKSQNRELQKKCEYLESRLRLYDKDDSEKQFIQIEDIDLSVRSYNVLKACRINSLGDLMQFSALDLMRFRNMGIKSLSEIIYIMNKYGLRLRKD